MRSSVFLKSAVTVTYACLIFEFVKAHFIFYEYLIKSLLSHKQHLEASAYGLHRQREIG